MNGPDIRTLMKADSFSTVLDPPVLEAWNAIVAVIERVLGKHRAPNYKKLVQKMLEAYKEIGVHMSLKIHLLHHHIDYFGRQFASESDEQGER